MTAPIATTSVSINAIDDGIITYADASAGVTISGTSTGFVSGATFSILVVDGAFSKTYTATVGTGGAWTATIPAADALTLGNGAATIKAQTTDGLGNVSVLATQMVTVAETPPTVTISPIDGNNAINQAQAAAGVTIEGGSTGLATGATFAVSVSDGAFSKSYTATVGAGGAWTATIPAADALGLLNGSATVTAAVSPTISVSQSVKVALTPPVFTALAETSATGDLDAGKSVTLTLTASEAVVVTGAPTLTLNDGGTATYDKAKSTATSLVFDYTVAAGQNVAALQASAVNLAGGSIDDLAGNPAILSLTGLTQNGPKIDTTAPTLLGLSSSFTIGDIGTGQTDVIKLTLSEAATVTGNVELLLSDGGAATYASGSGTNVLTFDYKVLAGQKATDLQIVGTAFAAGAEIADLAGNPLALSGLHDDLGLGVNDFIAVSGNAVVDVVNATSEDVVFATGASGTLVLYDSVGYTGRISGLAKTDKLDFIDISYDSLTKATFTGTATSGVLKVTDGVDTAAIKLLGDYVGATITLSAIDESSDSCGRYHAVSIVVSPKTGPSGQ